MSFEKFKPPKETNEEEKPSLPEENTLPLNIEESEEYAEGGESTIWKVATKSKGGLEKLIALKQVHKEAFASEEEMQKSKQFYEFLKNFPGFGKFVPESLYFKARSTPDDAPQAFCLQPFIEGERIDTMTDDELYRDPEVVRQLQEFIEAATDILRTARENKTHKPDFMRTPEPAAWNIRLGAQLVDPRYSSNVLITANPDKNGQRVFFIDTGIVVTERVNKARELYGRHVLSRLQELHFKHWKEKLAGILKE